MAQEPVATPAADLRMYIAVVRHRKLIILITLALMVAATMIFSLRQTPAYTSFARVQVEPVGAVSAIAPRLEPDMPTETGVAASPGVASIVKENLALGQSPEDLLTSLEVTAEGETSFLILKYTSTDPREAQRLSQGFADAYLQHRRAEAERINEENSSPLEAEADQLSKDINNYNKQFQKTKPGPKQVNRITQLGQNIGYAQGRLGALQQLLLPFRLAQISGGKVILPAQRPTAPSSPNYMRNLSMAAVIGLALGLGLAFLRERLDDRVKGGGDLEEQMGAPVLAAVPHAPGWKKEDQTPLISLEAPKGQTAEAYRTLRTNLQFVARHGDFKVLTVTSPMLGDGKTTTVANLAATLAQTGKRVIAVSCDLRKPRLHRFFGLKNQVGVTSVLAGTATLAQAAQRPGQDSLRILASGPVPPNPTELLESKEMGNLIEELRQAADFVIIDAPPILAVSDALILAPKSDGVVIVAGAGNTSRGAAVTTREQLDQVEARVVGCVLNNFHPGQAKYYPYYYRYYTTYGYYEDADGRFAGNGHEEEKVPESVWD